MSIRATTNVMQQINKVTSVVAIDSDKDLSIPAIGSVFKCG